MAKAKVTVLTAGSDLILGSASGVSSYAPHSFQVGDAAGYVAQKTESVPRGNTTYVGNSNLMQARIVENGVSRYLMTIPEGEGDFAVGNLVMYAVDVSGIPQPMLMVVLPFAIRKEISRIEAGDSGLVFPGNRLVVSVTLKHQVLQDGEGVDVTVEVIVPEYANLPYFDSDLNLPSPAGNPWAQFVVHDLTGSRSPGLVTKRGTDEHYWVQPFFSDINSPEYGYIDGGVVGDGYRESPYSWLWGQHYKTADGNFRGTVGGVGYTALAGTLTTVGGVPYKED